MTAPSFAPPSPAALRQRLREAVLTGLESTPRVTPATLFYDARGAALFEQICELPEYYPTRTEVTILDRHAHDLAACIGPEAAIIELGSGAATKVRPLLGALESPTAYVPVDVAGAQLRRIAVERAHEFPGLEVLPVVADYADGVPLPPLPDSARRVGFFPGSTIGNLHHDEAVDFLRSLAELVGPDGGLVLGVDRRKDPRVLNAAYNDAAGVTAEFNMNVLTRLNAEFHGTFQRTAFRHHAFFNDTGSRIEMHLEAITPQHARVEHLELDFAVGETIRTEVSYKYDRVRLDRLAAEAGWRVVERFSDSRDWFWVCWLVPASA